jgi:predicted DNA-binding transcriptional regulator YafY
MLPPRLRGRVQALGAYTIPTILGGGPSVDADALALIAQACRDRERLRFEYTARDGARATRLAEPHRLVTVGRRWYLVAWDVDREAWRTFRVDRLTDPRTIRYRFESRAIPGGDAAAFVNEQIALMSTTYDAVVDVRIPATDLERIVGGWGTVEDNGDGTCRLRMTVDSLDWPVMVLGAAGAAFVVVEPPELRERIRQMGELFMRWGDVAGSIVTGS